MVIVKNVLDIKFYTLDLARDYYYWFTNPHCQVKTLNFSL